MDEFKPFKIIKHDKYYFDEYWFHCTKCGAEYYRHRFDSRTRTVCSKCSAEQDKQKAKERAKNKEKTIRNKAIDEFAKRLKSEIEKELDNSDIAPECKKCGIWRIKEIDDLARDLKDGK